MTTAPSTLTMMALEPAGMLGTTQSTAAAGQSTLTIAISARKAMPMSETKPMMMRSILP